MQSERIVRERERRDLTGIPSSSWYDLIKKGLAPPAVRIGKYASGWPNSELDALIAARIAGKAEGEIRNLVKRLLEGRKQAFEPFEAA